MPPTLKPKRAALYAVAFVNPVAHKVVTPRLVYGAELLPSAGKRVAARMLLSTLVAKRLCDGVPPVVLAARWGLLHTTVEATSRAARQELAYRVRGRFNVSERARGAVPDIPSRKHLWESAAVYTPLLEDMDVDYCLDLDDPPVEALLRGMFDLAPAAVYLPHRRPSEGSGSDLAGKRPRGRPPGAKNKSKQAPPAPRAEWPLPEGVTDRVAG